jgi:hypothetical protein
MAKKKPSQREESKPHRGPMSGDTTGLAQAGKGRTTNKSGVPGKTHGDRAAARTGKSRGTTGATRSAASRRSTGPKTGTPSKRK